MKKALCSTLVLAAAILNVTSQAILTANNDLARPSNNFLQQASPLEELAESNPAARHAPRRLAPVTQIAKDYTGTVSAADSAHITITDTGSGNSFIGGSLSASGDTTIVLAISGSNNTIGNI
jgi:hypothetical protein